ncbi:hypothetical protein M427DRAFT_53925 [Gonapodya prolifera JEL478]|uniref:Carbohydrate esterase family 16 protein n=1 Tax=Gonapodya prolifera (strain JEL478) TaxID=1344416 RepID=A0A139AMT7_GONPJ|nr:hypothetical protein M427DRAFT_53925 [Gonapodya prolifera JEL478]|eukprot:KXS18076.1 hypothetical protein M427DRAFT_53925 [Gonapodya prolifera JEL478]
MAERRLLPFLAALVLLLLIGSCGAQRLFIDGHRIETAVVFGDSLSDNGNYYAASGNRTPGPPYYNGRFSNGPLWIEDLANVTGIRVVNYAFAAATTDLGGNTTSSSLPGNDGRTVRVNGLLGQVQDFLGNATVLPSNAAPALFVWIGGNDYTKALGASALAYSPDNATSAVVANITNIVKSLDGKASAIVVIGLPDMSKLPLIALAAATGGPVVVPLLTNALLGTTRLHNAKLAASLQALNTTSKSTLKFVDPFNDPFVAEFTARNFTVTNGSCLNFGTNGSYTVCSDPDQYLYWDWLHPTAKAHSFIAQLTLNQINSSTPTNVSATFTTSSSGATNTTASTASPASASATPTGTKQGAAARRSVAWGWSMAIFAGFGCMLAML